MRSATGGELAVLASAAFQVYDRLEVQNLDGTWKDLTTLGGFNWLLGYDIGGDIDQPTGDATFTLRREHVVGTHLSLAPLRDDSTLNRRDDGVTYAPILDAGRPIRFSQAAVAFGTTPVSGDYKRLFEGVIDVTQWDREPMSVVARDAGGFLQDYWTLNNATVFSVAGGNAPAAIESVIQSILTGESTGITVFTPVSPGYNINQFAYGLDGNSEAVMDVLQRLISGIGWDLRYRWDSGTSSFRLTFKDPGRSITTPVVTIGSGQYVDVKNLKIDRAQVRNFVTIFFGPGGAGRLSTSLIDAGSQARYGVRRLVINEATDSPVDTLAEANTMAANVIADLKDPKADQQIEMLPFWPVELNDLIQFTQNGVHYNADQKLAVVRYRHTGSVDAKGKATRRTTIDVRGKPAGMYVGWKRRGLVSLAPDLAFLKSSSADPNIVDSIPLITTIQSRQSPLAAPATVTNLLTNGGALGQYQSGRGISFGMIEFDVLSVGGIVDVLLWDSNGGTGPNGYFFRFDGRSGQRAGQLLKVANGTWSNIGTFQAVANAGVLSGWHNVKVRAMGGGSIGRYDIWVDGIWMCTAVDNTFACNAGLLYYGYEVTSGPTLSPAKFGKTADQTIDGSTKRVTTLNEATGGGRGWLAIDGVQEIYLNGSGSNSGQKVHIGTQGTPAAMQRVYRIPYGAFAPTDQTITFTKTGGRLRPGTVNVAAIFIAGLTLPLGATITGILARSYRGTSSDVANVAIAKETDGSISTLTNGASNHATTGWASPSNTPSEVVSSGVDVYVVTVTLQGVAAVADAQLSYVEITVTVPDLNTGL